jgi:hypothetical protein
MGSISGVQRTAAELVEYIDVAKVSAADLLSFAPPSDCFFFFFFLLLLFSLPFQRMGNVAWRASQEDGCYLFISKFGAKFMDMKKYVGRLSLFPSPFSLSLVRARLPSSLSLPPPHP